MSTRLVLFLAGISLLALLSSFSLAEAKKIYVGGRNAWNPWGPGVRKWKGPHKVFRGDTLVFRWKKKSNLVMLADETDPAAPYYFDKCTYDTTNPALHTVVAEAKASGSAKFTIAKDSAALHYWFISTVGKTCKNGQKYETPPILTK